MIVLVVLAAAVVIAVAWIPVYLWWHSFPNHSPRDCMVRRARRHADRVLREQTDETARELAVVLGEPFCGALVDDHWTTKSGIFGKPELWCRRTTYLYWAEAHHLTSRELAQLIAWHRPRDSTRVSPMGAVESPEGAVELHFMPGLVWVSVFEEKAPPIARLPWTCGTDTVEMNGYEELEALSAQGPGAMVVCSLTYTG